MKRMHLMLMAILLSWFTSAQINSNAAYSTDDHIYEVIAYVPQWDAWKMVNGQQRALNHFNIDYSQYTILNFSFFGVAQDGSLHSADLRNPQIYQSSQVQQPAALLHPDPTSSHDQALVLGTQTTFWSWNAELIQYGYQARTDCGYSGCGWIDTTSGQQGVWPLNVTTGPSLIDLGHQAGKKVMASIGGWSMSKHFPEMAADPVKRATFISDCQILINQYGFDGIDLDWEYPGDPGMNIINYSSADYANFEVLIAELRQAIGPNKLITAAFSADPNKLSGFNWSNLDNLMDYYNFMTYDYNGGWSGQAGHNSALYDWSGSESSSTNWNATYNGLISLGVNTSKANFGVAFYGRGVKTNGTPALNAPTLKSNQTFAVDGPVFSAADLVNWGPYEGSPYYYEIQSVLNSGSWTEHWDAQAQVPYLLHNSGDYFLSYDNDSSIALKAEYVRQKGMAGVIIWEVFTDYEVNGPETADYNGYPYLPNTVPVLAHALNTALANGVVIPPPSNTPPQITFISPSANQTINNLNLDPITLQVNATDLDGSITQVRFNIDGSWVSALQDSGSYTFNWTPSTFGTYTLVAEATDDSLAVTLDSIQFIVAGGMVPAPPFVQINSPINSQNFIGSSSVNVPIDLSVSVANSVTISEVGVIVNGDTNLVTPVGGNYSLNKTFISSGNYILEAYVEDSYGQSASSTTQISVSIQSVPVGNSSIRNLISPALWDSLFPYRNGIVQQNGGAWVRQSDFYTLDAFVQAYEEMSNYTLKLERRCGSTAYRITRIDTLNNQIVVREDADFTNSSGSIITEYMSFADFAHAGSTETRKRELASFLANISQETTGGWSTAPGGSFAWGLYFKEEQGYEGTSNIGYQSPHAIYPPVSNKSYHGRGPIQLSYNYNYGQCSEILFGDKNVLLNNPEMVSEDSVTAFKTALWFWMTPQHPKPSAHAAMTGSFTPSADDVANNRVPGFGLTVNIINGGVECGGGSENIKVLSRISFFERHAGFFNVTTALDGSTNCNCGCANMTQFVTDVNECNSLPLVRFIQPGAGDAAVVDMSNGLTAVNIVTENLNLPAGFTQQITVDGQTVSGGSFNWTPSSFGNYIATTTVTTSNADIYTDQIEISLFNSNTMQGCNGIEMWEVNRVYDIAGSFVNYNGTIYKNLWWVDGSGIPGVAPAWASVGTCSGSTSNQNPMVSFLSPADGQTINQMSLSAISLRASAMDESAITAVVFTVNGINLSASLVNGNYEVSWTPSAFGSYVIDVTATDDSNATASAQIQINVVQSQNAVPLVSIVSPSNGAIISQSSLASIAFQANASDNDGSISSVTFDLGNGAQSANWNGSVYELSWIPSTYGSYTLTATATDNQGATATDVISFSVVQDIDTGTSGNACDTIAFWQAQVYATPWTYVQYNGQVYHNEWWVGASAVPGVSSDWKQDFYCDPSTEPRLCGYVIWDAAAIYPVGYQDTVVHNSKIWTPQWYANAGDEPGVNSVWLELGDCNSSAKISRGSTGSAIASERSISIYPNPATDQFWVEGELNRGERIEILDLSGRNVFQVKLDEDSQRYQLNVGSLPVGLYIVRVTGGKLETINQRLIIN